MKFCFIKLPSTKLLFKLLVLLISLLSLFLVIFNNCFALYPPNPNNVEFDGVHAKFNTNNAKFRSINSDFNPVEKAFLETSKRLAYYPSENIPVIESKDINELGKLTALSFIYWVQNNPHGVIAMPFGKTADAFILYLKYYKENWNKKRVQEDLKKYGINFKKFPETSNLKLVQTRCFYPDFLNEKDCFLEHLTEHYIKVLNINMDNVLSFSSYGHSINELKGYDAILQDHEINLGLLNRNPRNKIEQWQKEFLLETQELCKQYDKKIREWGGIGFFISAISYDGYILYNLPGAKFDSKTRMIKLNYAASATSANCILGGMEHTRGKTVLTVGLDTLTFNKDAVCIIFAAGKSKAQAIKNVVERKMSDLYPGTIFQKMPKAKVYITKEAGIYLQDRNTEDIASAFREKPDQNILLKIISEISFKENKPILKLTQKEISKYSNGMILLSALPNAKSLSRVLREMHNEVVNRIKTNIANKDFNKRFLHVGLEQNDILLSYFSKALDLLENPSNDNYFVYLTSGYKSISDDYIRYLFDKLYEDWLLKHQRIFFKLPYEELFKYFKKAYLSNDKRRMLKSDKVTALRKFILAFEIKNLDELKEKLRWLKDEYFASKLPGTKSQVIIKDSDIQKIKEFKRTLRELESDRLWHIYDVPKNNVSHLRLNFYFKNLVDLPYLRKNFSKDVKRFGKVYRELNPDYITVLDVPYGSRPISNDNFIGLQLIGDALRADDNLSSNIKIWCYKNIWDTFEVNEANIMIPVSKKDLNKQKKAFEHCFASQKNTFYPSPFYDGDFVSLTKANLKKQFNKLKILLGEDYFTNNPNPEVQTAEGFIFMKEMSKEEFLKKTIDLTQLFELVKK